MSKKHLPLFLLVLLLLAVTLGCGSSGTMSPPPPPASKAEFLYAITFQPPPATVRELMIFKLDLATGSLSLSSEMTVQPTVGIVVDPSSRFLYLSDPNPSLHVINIFSIDPKTGSLTPSAGFILDNDICPFCPPPPNGPGALAMDPKGKFLYYGSNEIGPEEVVGGLSVSSTTGKLNLVPGSPFPANDMPYSVLVHPSGHFLYTENLPSSFGIDGINVQGFSGFSIDSNTGALTPVPGSPFIPPVTASFSGFAIHPAGKFLYASTGTAGNGILAWSIDNTTGALTALPASPFDAGATHAGVTVTPSGKFLYSSKLSAGGIAGFNIDTGSGALTPMTGSPFDQGRVLIDEIVDPSGKFLIAVDTMNKAITVYSIDASTGALTPRGSPTPVSPFFISLVMARTP